jgi:UDP-GlcNAc:undecaprenyl-phosphate GlcNAc-1-phosphate transferase
MTGEKLSLGNWGIVLTVIWIVVITNAINLLDGLDGLAAGITAIVAFTLFLATIRINFPLVTLLSLVLAGSAIGFLPYNFHPAKIFMGDCGSMFLGFTLSAISIAGYGKGVVGVTLFVPIIAMGVPLLDTFLTIVRRIRNRVPVFRADKGHIHHRLLKTNVSQRKTVVSLYFLTGCLGLIAISFMDLRGIYAIVALVLTGIIIFKWVKGIYGR